MSLQEGLHSILSLVYRRAADNNIMGVQEGQQAIIAKVYGKDGRPRYYGSKGRATGHIIMGLQGGKLAMISWD